ncbi:MAG TPA: ABC transporter permease [Puia sp.]|nr:ABC transporter permease [Puia sp.]
MLKNYLKVALRNLWRHKAFSVINIMGLAVGVTCCVLIMVYIRSEFSYDRFHEKASRIYRLWQYEKADGQEFINTVTSIPAGPAIKDGFPEVQAYCRVYAFNGMVSSGIDSFNEALTMVDPSFFGMFDFALQQDSREAPFANPSFAIITPSIAKKYFGNKNPVGKNIRIHLGDASQLFTVAGIAGPAPEESSIRFDILIPWSNEKLVFQPRVLHNWFNVFNETYLLLGDRTKKEALEKKFPTMMREQLGAEFGHEEYDLHLQPLASIHLDRSLPSGIRPTSDPKYSYILGTIAMIILLVACINFVTLSVGRSTTRALEVGIRKALGAARKQLIRQFWGEALLVTAVATFIGIILASLLMPVFNHLVNRNLSFHPDWLFILFYVLLAGLTGLIAGIYPAIILSGFNAVEVLKGKLNLQNGSGLFRKALIVGQFAASIVLIISTVVISDQMEYLNHKDLGYDKDQLVIVPTNRNRMLGYPLARLYLQELSRYPQVAEATVSTFSFAETPWATLGYADSKKQYHSFEYNEVSHSFTDAMKIRIISGRSFQEDNTSDPNNSILVNEALVKEFGIKDPIGKKLGNYSQTIVGVMKDFNYESLRSEIKPLVLSEKFDTIARQSSDVSFANEPQPRVSVRMRPGNLQENISVLRKAWSAVAPRQDFEYHFLDERLAHAYEQEQKSATVVRIASGLSLFIACMGLFGLATLTVTRRTKEIGVRKILGAGVPQLVGLLSRDFVVLVLAGSLVAFPLAWWATHSWLSNFAYRTTVSWWIFPLTALASVMVAILTVASQAIRAASENPVRSLRNE